MTDGTGRLARGADRQPVQVYLDPNDLKRLERLRQDLGTNKSEVLRRGLKALEREIMDPDEHPVLKIIGLVDGPLAGSATADQERPFAVASGLHRVGAESEPEPRRGSKKKKKQRGR
jgi:hypothetical protein